MNLDHTAPYFNITLAGCRAADARGGRARARGLSVRKTTHVAAVVATSQSGDETARQAIEHIDALCPWLKGCEFRPAGGPA